MKVCVINNFYPPYNRGGAEVVVENQVEDLSRKGNDVFVISTKALLVKKKSKHFNYKIYRFFSLNIFSIYHISKFPALLRVVWRIFDIFNIYARYRIEKILKQRRPDIIYTHNLTGISYLIPRLIKKINIKHVHTVHDVALIYPSGLLISGAESSLANKIYRNIYAPFCRFLFGSPDEVIFPSSWLKKLHEDLKFFPDSKKMVQLNYKAESRNLLSNKKFKNPNEIILLYAGQIEKHKGIFELINSIFNLQPSACSLHIFGSGSEEKLLQEIINHNENIIYHGWKPLGEIRIFLKEKVDYTIIPSLCYENSPTIIHESLGLGVPVVASNIGGTNELVFPGRNGHLFNPQVESGLTEILKQCIIKAG